MSQHVFLLSDCACSVKTWITAENEDDALIVLRKTYGNEFPEGQKGKDWRIFQLPDNKIIEITEIVQQPLPQG